MAERTGIFISYSHLDAVWLKKLSTALQPLVFAEKIVPWDDRSIPPGADWLAEINTAMATARIAVMLVTQNFLASSFINRKELPALLERRSQGLGFFWIPIEDTLYKFTPLKDVQSAWDTARPLSGLNKAERASALVKIATTIATWQPATPPGG